MLGGEIHAGVPHPPRDDFFITLETGSRAKVSQGEPPYRAGESVDGIGWSRRHIPRRSGDGPWRAAGGVRAVEHRGCDTFW